MLPGLLDLRGESIEDALTKAAACDCVVSVEGVLGHAFAAWKKPIIVLWGGAGNVSLTGYPIHDNVITDSPCRCFGSVDVSFVRKDCDRSCMERLPVDKVYQAVVRELRRIGTKTA
jgi:ADP-heptose:LPS heptosyltransferase